MKCIDTYLGNARERERERERAVPLSNNVIFNSLGTPKVYENFKIWIINLVNV